MCKSCILGFVAFLGFVSSIVGASQLAIVVIYYTELPPMFLVLSLVTGTFIFTLSSCIIGSIITMVRTSVNISGKIGVSFALGSICMVTTVDLLLLLLQCHWILDQKVLTDIGPFQLQCIKSVTDISEGIFLLVMANSVTLGISTFALLLTCFWKIRKHPDAFQTSVLSSNWVYENSIGTNNVSERDTTFSEHNFKQSRRFGKTHMEIPKIHFKSTNKGSISSNNLLLRNTYSYCPESPEQPLHTFADIVAAIPPQTSKPSEKSLSRLTSFAPHDVKKQLEPYYEQPCLSSENEFSESNCAENNSFTLKCGFKSLSRSDPKLISNSEDISHWLKQGKWRKHTVHQNAGTRILKLSMLTPGCIPPSPGYTPQQFINLQTDNISKSDSSISKNNMPSKEMVTPKQDNLPKIKITPPNEEFNGDINDAINSLDSVLHLTPSVSTASYRNSSSPHSAGSFPI